MRLNDSCLSTVQCTVHCRGERASACVLCVPLSTVHTHTSLIELSRKKRTTVRRRRRVQNVAWAKEMEKRKVLCSSSSIAFL